MLSQRQKQERGQGWLARRSGLPLAWEPLALHAEKRLRHDSTQRGIVALALPLLADVPRLRGFELPAPPALVGSWRAVGFETVTSRLSRLSRCPAVAFSASVEARTLPGFTCCPDEIPMMGSYYSPRPMTPMIQAREGRFIGVRAWGARRPASWGLELATQVSEPPPAKAEISPRPQAEGAGNTVLPVEAPLTRGFVVLGDRICSTPPKTQDVVFDHRLICA